MRLFFVAIVVFTIIHIVKTDIEVGTIPYEVSANVSEECEDETEIIRVTSIQGDTIESLFGIYPDPFMSFIDRLNIFYQLNPHLQNQPLTEGQTILLPIKKTICQNEK